jgi:uncharacterized membrane protein
MASARYSSWVLRGAILISALLMAIAVWYAATWQNSVRRLMGLEELNSVQPLHLFTIALAIFIVLLILSRLFLRTFRLASKQLERVLQPRAAQLLGFVVCLWLLWALSEGHPWGAYRIVFLQHASDPITFFDPYSAWSKPEWMNDPRGQDVSSELRWFPVVTMLQLAVDMIAGTAPPGFGHNYSPRDYIKAWIGLTETKDWSDADLNRLYQRFDNSTPVADGAP